MAGLFRYNDPSKGPPIFREVEGMNTVDDLSAVFLKGVSREEHYERLKNLKMRDDDTLLCAFPKSGRSGCRRLLHVMISQ